MANGDRTSGNGSIDWRPLWGGSFEAWAKKYVGKNLWRVNKQFAHEDAMQECVLIFLRCAKLYEGKIDNPAWFMSIFKISVINDFNTFAKRDSRMRQAEAMAAHAYEPRHHIEFSQGPLMAIISKGSEELKQVLKVIVESPSEFVGLLLQDAKIEMRDNAEPLPQEAAISRSLCRLARTKNVRSDLLSELRILLSKSISSA
jgi:DNA-directed RNA polymerase specialized sigma24 family protein